MKIDELQTARLLLDKLAKDYPTMFREDGNIKIWGYNKMKTCPTQVKSDIKTIRRLLLEVANEL